MFQYFLTDYKYSLSCNNITSKGISLLLDTMREQKIAIKSLILGANNIDDESMISLGKFLSGNQSIRNVDISGGKKKENKLTNKGIEILSEILESETSLKELDISKHKNITQKAQIPLIKIVEKSKVVVLSHQGTSIEPNPKLRVLISVNRLKNGSQDVNISG